MKKQLSSLDLHFLLKEFEMLENSRISKIYNQEKNTILLSLYKTNVGKKLLKINIGQFLAIVEEKETEGESLGFGMLLRKHLDGFFLVSIEQLLPERIIKMTFKVKDETKYLYLGFFGKGNAILCNEHNVIINALEHYEFRERVVKPKLKYVYPIMRYNIFDVSRKQMEELFQNSRKDSIVTCLAVELGLGGVYSEEVCLLSEIDKNENPNNVDGKQIELLLGSIKEILNKKMNPEVILQDNNPVDATPFSLKFYEKSEKKNFSSFNEALSFFYSHFTEIKKTDFDKKLRGLQRIIDEQKQAIAHLREEEKELRVKGEFIYHKYNLVKEILDEINKASKKHGWKEVKEKLKDHKIIKEVDEENRKVIVEVD